MQAGMRDSFPSFQPREILGETARLTLLERRQEELSAALAKETAERRAMQARIEPNLWVLEGAGALRDSIEKVVRRGVEEALWIGLLWLVSHVHLGG